MQHFHQQFVQLKEQGTPTLETKMVPGQEADALDTSIKALKARAPLISKAKLVK